MFIKHLIAHAGVSPILSQTSLMLVMIALALSLVGVVYGRIKGAELLRLHRWTMTMAVAILLVPVAFVMLPATFRFYTDPDVEIGSALSLLTIVHGALGFPMVVMGLMFALNDLPRNVRAWMRRTTWLLMAAFVVGLILFLTMLDIISFNFGMAM
jgi:hypothetical protein